MKLITLIYQSNNITDSINIKLFFELAGIYVYEIQSDIKINISNQDKILSLSDAIICLDDDYLNDTYKQYNKYIIYKSLSNTIEYCLKNNLIDKYEYDDLISLYQLGNSFKIVEARIYDNLIEIPEIAFQIYNECCNNIYDAYVYLYKAEIMSKKNSIDRAIDYYNKSIYINPQYYKAISKLAFCYLKKQSFFVAYNYYNTVIIILKNKAKSDNLNIMDYHYIYNACINMIKIDIILDNYRSALELCTYALEIYKSINRNKFYSKFKIDCAHVRKDIISVLNIDMLKKHGIELSTKYGLFDLCKEFSKL